LLGERHVGRDRIHDRLADPFYTPELVERSEWTERIPVRQNSVRERRTDLWERENLPFLGSIEIDRPGR